MIKWVCYTVIGILCFVISFAILAIPQLILPGFEFGSMPTVSVLAAVISYFCTPGIYRKIVGIWKK